jgi:hypothetical protein
MTVIIVTGHSAPFEMDYYRYPFGSMYLTFFFFIELDFKACLNEATLFGRNCRMSSLRRSNRYGVDCPPCLSATLTNSDYALG